MASEDIKTKAAKQPSWDLVLYRLDEITNGQLQLYKKFDEATMNFVTIKALEDQRKMADEQHNDLRKEILAVKQSTEERFKTYTWVIRTLFVIVAGIVVDALVRVIAQNVN